MMTCNCTGTCRETGVCRNREVPWNVVDYGQSQTVEYPRRCAWCGSTLDWVGNCPACQGGQTPPLPRPEPRLHGWVCGKCGRSNAPYVSECPCTFTGYKVTCAQS